MIQTDRRVRAARLCHRCARRPESATMDASGVVTGVYVVERRLRIHVGSVGHDPRTADQARSRRRCRYGDDRHRPDRPHLAVARVMTRAPTVTITDTVGVPDKGASATATVAVKGAVTDINVTDRGRRLPHAGPEEVRRHAARSRPDGRERPRQVHPGRRARHDHVPGQRTTTRSRSSSTGISSTGTCRPTLLRGYVQLSTRVVPGHARRAGQREPRPERCPTPRSCSDGTRPTASTTRTTSARPSSPRRTGRSGSCSATCCPPASPATCSCPSTPRSWAPAPART